MIAREFQLGDDFPSVDFAAWKKAAEADQKAQSDGAKASESKSDDKPAKASESTATSPKKPAKET